MADGGAQNRGRRSFIQPHPLEYFPEPRIGSKIIQSRIGLGHSAEPGRSVIAGLLHQFQSSIPLAEAGMYDRDRVRVHVSLIARVEQSIEEPSSFCVVPRQGVRVRQRAGDFPHAGGTVPFLADRIMRLAARDPRAAERVPEGPMAVLKRLYYDLAQSANRHAMAALLTVADHSHILFGSDFPFAAEPVVAATVDGLRKLPLSEQNFRLIERENALSLLPHFRDPV